MWLEAVEYNKVIAKYGFNSPSAQALTSKYEHILDPTGRGMMGYVSIDKVGLTLPIYHGTQEDILQTAVGHLEWTSLPVGGKSSHCVLSAHRGLPSARLFTDIDEMREGDYFTLNILEEMLTYQVDQIRIVEPDQVGDLQIVKGKDYCTLVTCTPYGINTHRLLVRATERPIYMIQELSMRRLR